jgi:hypothetical protein
MEVRVVFAIFIFWVFSNPTILQFVVVAWDFNLPRGGVANPAALVHLLKPIKEVVCLFL